MASASPAPRAGRLAPYIMVAPALVLLAGLVLVPLVLVLATSFTDWRLGAGPPSFVGLDNFALLFSDPDFRRALVNTASFVLAVVPTTAAIGLFVALLISGCRRGQAAYRAIYFLPVVATLAAMAVAWQMLLSPSVGAVAQALRWAGFTAPNWLQDTQLALPALAVIGIWSELGFAMLFFLAGLNAIPRELYEAAALDGCAGFWDRLWLVTLPQLAPITLFIVVITTIHALRVFDTVAIITRGGPEKSTIVLLYYIYHEAFSLFRTNLAAAATVVFIVVVLALSTIQLRLGTRSRVA